MYVLLLGDRRQGFLLNDLVKNWKQVDISSCKEKSRERINGYESGRLFGHSDQSDISL